MKILGIGIANKSNSGEILDVYFSNIEFGDIKVKNKNYEKKLSTHENIQLNWTKDDLEKPIQNVQEAYFKLHLLSYKFVLPNTINFLKLHFSINYLGNYLQITAPVTVTAIIIQRIHYVAKP